jgi:hypothetical protein
MASGRASCGLLRMLSMAKPVRGITGQSKSLFGAPCLAHGLGGCTVNAAKGDESVSARRSSVPVPALQATSREKSLTDDRAQPRRRLVALCLASVKTSNRVFSRFALRSTSIFAIPHSDVINTTHNEAPNT